MTESNKKSRIPDTTMFSEFTVGIVALAYFIYALRPKPIDPEYLEFEEQHTSVEFEWDDDTSTGIIVEAPLDDNVSEQEESDDDETSSQGSKEQEESDDDETSSHSSKEEDNSESSYDMLEHSVSNSDAEEESKSENDDTASKSDADSDDEEEIMSASKSENDDNASKYLAASASDSDDDDPAVVVWKSVCGKGYAHFWNEVKEDLGTGEIAHIVMRRFRRNTEWSWVDTFWWAVMSKNKPLDLLHDDPCPKSKNAVVRSMDLDDRKLRRAVD